MPLNLGRWVSYAKARVETAVGRGNDELTRLEAEREVELAEKPWLRADAESPTLDEARARIEYEAKRQQLADERDRAAANPAPSAATPSGDPEAAATSAGSVGPSAPASWPTPTSAGEPSPGAPTPPRDPEALRLAAEAEQAKLAIEARDRAAAERLDEIRRELGVDAPPPGGSSA